MLAFQYSITRSDLVDLTTELSKLWALMLIYVYWCILNNDEIKWIIDSHHCVHHRTASKLGGNPFLSFFCHHLSHCHYPFLLSPSSLTTAYETRYWWKARRAPDPLLAARFPRKITLLGLQSYPFITTGYQAHSETPPDGYINPLGVQSSSQNAIVVFWYVNLDRMHADRIPHPDSVISILPLLLQRCENARFP